MEQHHQSRKWLTAPDVEEVLWWSVGESGSIVAGKPVPVGRHTHIPEWQSEEGAHLRGH